MLLCHSMQKWPVLTLHPEHQCVCFVFTDAGRFLDYVCVMLVILLFVFIGADFCFLWRMDYATCVPSIQ
jgi:hypothetical protein